MACIFKNLAFNFFFIKKTYLDKFFGVPPGLANSRPPGRAKLVKAPPPGLTRRAYAPKLPGEGGGAKLELTDA